MGVIGDQLKRNTSAPVAATPVMSKTEKFKAIDALSKEADKKHETTNTFMRLGSRVALRLPSICTGLPTLDEHVIQCGGIPKGRIVEIFGPESAGKTTLALHIIAECQRAGGVAAFIDAEHALDPVYARDVVGVNIDELVINQPDNGEEALQNADALVESDAVDLIVVDSVAALVPKAELEGEIGDAHMGLQARLMSQAMRILTGKASKHKVIVIFINQIREKIGVMFGSPETTTGGRALKFFSSLRLDVRRISKAIMDGDVMIGHKLKVKAVKNKVGVPFRETEIALMYGAGNGIDKAGNVVQYAVDRGIITTAGAWYSFNGEKLANGLDNTKALLKDDAEQMQRINAAIAVLRKADIEAAIAAANPPKE